LSLISFGRRILTATAFGEVTAHRFDPLERWFFNAQQLCAREMFFDLGEFDLDHLAHEHERDKHNKIVHASDAFAAKRNVVNGQIQPVADLE